MISHISIKNFAIIKDLDVDFHSGLNIITGETGAGKSIIIEAVSLALGSRADTAFVRTGEDKAIIQMAGTLDNEEIVIQREVSASGRNLCKLNGEIVTLTQLSSLCRKLADIHGQYDHQSLLNVDYHISLVDLYGKSTVFPIKEKVSSTFEKYIEIKQELKTLLDTYEENQRNRDFMSFELQEIEQADLTPGEDEELDSKIALMQNAEKIYGALEQMRMISAEGSEDSMTVAGGLSKMVSIIREISGLSPELEKLEKSISEVYYTMEDINGDLRNALESAAFSPEELNEAIERQEVVEKLKRKHGGSIESVLEYEEQISLRLSKIENIDGVKTQLTEQLAELEEKLKSVCATLTLERKDKAKELEKQIQRELTELNFNNAEISIDFKDTPNFTPEGTDIVEFLISTNKGEPLKPLAKIASGGEMSRIMLAFKKIISDYDRIPTMIFDEIDSGISGITASIVGTKLLEISQERQIICITHLPQIAACGHHNYLIKKVTDSQNAFTTVVPLNTNEKIQEIARLLGGSNITETTLRSAKELIDASEY